MVSIKDIDTISGFKMVISYQLPCSYAFYSELSNNQEISKLLCGVIGRNLIVEAIHPNLTVIELQFKKFMLLEPRVFNFLKYQNSTGASHWEVCISAKGRPSCEQNEKECELMVVSCFEEQKSRLTVNTYLEVDLKSNIRARKVVHRGCEEMASYFDKLWDYAR